MKKILILIIILFFATGCTIKQIDNKSISDIVLKIIKEDTNLTNRVGIGYDYYMPINMQLSDVTEYNEVLYSQGIKYYLYVDLISYESKMKSSYNIDSKLFFSKEIKNKNKFGYIQIDKIDNQYYIEMMYNYAKIETYVYDYQLKDSVMNISYILSSISYNDKIIKSLIAEEKIKSNGKQYSIFKPKTTSNNYIGNIDEVIDINNAIDDPDVINVEFSY